jgi:transcriptional regulator with GAF, ATPase, and Fis domain
VRIQIKRTPKRATIVVIDGEPYLMAGAAQVLGLKPKALAKRLQRGSSLSRPGKWRGYWG